MSHNPVGLATVPTIVAIGPFDDRAHAEHLAAAFVTVRRLQELRLIVLGPGVHGASIMRRIIAQGLGRSVHAYENHRDSHWSDVVAAADLVVLSSSSDTATLLDVLAAGRPVVCPADPATVGLVVTGIAGLVYPPGDVSAMTSALQRLLTAPVLRRGMGGRARNVARRHRLETIGHQSTRVDRICSPNSRAPLPKLPQQPIRLRKA
jgi:glycosyltransferase involved in cell wall biosynthesis